MTTVRILLTIAALSMLLACATDCAAFNRSEYAVHTTVGQELIDLKALPPVVWVNYGQAESRGLVG